jgi:hypothetical protein
MDSANQIILAWIIWLQSQSLFGQMAISNPIPQGYFLVERFKDSSQLPMLFLWKNATLMI